MNEKSHPVRPYPLASDFDQTLSFHDTGTVLSALLGIAGFQEEECVWKSTALEM